MNHEEQIRNLAHLLEKHQNILQTLHKRITQLEQALRETEQVVRDIQTGTKPEQL